MKAIQRYDAMVKGMKADSEQKRQRYQEVQSTKTKRL